MAHFSASQLNRALPDLQPSQRISWDLSYWGCYALFSRDVEYTLLERYIISRDSPIVKTRSDVPKSVDVGAEKH